MATINLECVAAAKYNNNNGTVTYTDGAIIAKAIKANISFDVTDDVLYADGVISEAEKEITGGKVKFGIDELDFSAHNIFFGNTVTPATTGENPTPERLSIGRLDKSNDIGVGTIRTITKNRTKIYLAMILFRGVYDQPPIDAETRAKTIKYQTPEISGVLMPHEGTGMFIDIAKCATFAAALVWVKAQLNIT